VTFGQPSRIDGLRQLFDQSRSQRPYAAWIFSSATPKAGAIVSRGRPGVLSMTAPGDPGRRPR